MYKCTIVQDNGLVLMSNGDMKDEEYQSYWYDEMPIMMEAANFDDGGPLADDDIMYRETSAGS